MEQNEQARLSALSNASMLSAIGVTLMYGLSLLLALLAPASVAVGVVSLIGLILWLVGIYNTSSAFKGFNAAVAASFERLFKAQLVIVIAVVAYWVLIILIPQILGYKGAKASIVIIKLLTIALFARLCTWLRAIKNAVHSRASGSNLWGPRPSRSQFSLSSLL